MHELVLLAPEPALDALSERLVDDLDALSVSVEDAAAGAAGEHALFAEPGVAPAHVAWPLSRVAALFADEPRAEAAAMQLLADGALPGVRIEALRPVADQDWVRLTQQQFDPVAISAGFWIVPSWHAVPADATHAIRLDPGLAFGTGTHPTTRMCLRWIARHGADGLRGRRVLDYGCGSGVLAIAAALHGARTVDAVDIDPAAITSAQANASANAVAMHCGPPDLARGEYDLVIANILAAPLRVLAPLLCAHIARDGELLLAGILARQADELTLAYAPWLALSVADEDEGWVLLRGAPAEGRMA
jgi:ribosomal protein L11 methyltransferase